MPLMCWLENLSLIRLRHVCLRMPGVVSLPVSVLSVCVTACKVLEISEALRFLCGSIWSSMLSIGWNVWGPSAELPSATGIVSPVRIRRL